MAESRSEYFDPEGLAQMRLAFDEVWRTLPFNQQSSKTRDALGRVIIHFATHGERDHLSLYAFTAVSDEYSERAVRV